MKKGFTLIELLVVIAIIAILAAILFPVFAKAREKARQTTCISNQKQIALAVNMYVQENEETMPMADGWVTAIDLSGKVLTCPNTPTLPISYVYNNHVAGLKLGEIQEPVEVVLTADGKHEATAAVTGPPAKAATYNNVAYKAVDYAMTRHGGKMAIASYVDGHVTTITRPLMSPAFAPDFASRTPIMNDISVERARFDETTAGKLSFNGTGTSGWSTMYMSDFPIPADGYIEFKISITGDGIMVGLDSDRNVTTSNGYNTLDYAIHINGPTNISSWFYQTGGNLANPTESQTYKPNETVFRIQRIGDTVTYYVGTYQIVSAKKSTGTLYPSFALQGQQSYTITDIKIAGVEFPD